MACYISCACNRTPHAADWGFNGLICYGACYAVAIYDPMLGGGGRVIATLTGHKGRVNAVKWVKRTNSKPETELVSVSSDSFGLVWRKSDATDEFMVSTILEGHESSVNVVDAIYQPGGTLIVATASADSTVRIWERKAYQKKYGGIPMRDPGSFVADCINVVPLGSGVCLSVSLALHTSSVLLACALDDSHIHIYGKEKSGGEFTKCQVLTGHEDWVIALDFTTEDGGDLLLASGSQDCTVRLWRFHPPHTGSTDQLFHVEEKLVSLGSVKVAVSIESVLMGHDGRVYGVRWHPPVATNNGHTQPLKLLTASLDKTVVLWSPEEQSGVWLEEARMGEVGGNTLGFYGACFGPSGSAILAHSYQGGFHIWHKHQDRWRAGVVVGGHFDAVMDLAWEPLYGRYVVSISSDQTTRLHAPWIPAEDMKKYSWHEIARPQVHGYDLVCLAMLPGFRFASGADEKVIRAFTAPQNFLENFNRLCLKNLKDSEMIDTSLGLPMGAAVPVLGLSNKAVFQNEVNCEPQERHVKDQYDDNSYFTPQHLVEPPTEDNLLQNTLWPETMKLYGHGYEIFSLATTTDGKLLASASKATNEEHAAILLWDTSSWHQVGRLVSHKLTITQMQFSPDDHFLLSVSRDRCWSIFQRDDSESDKYKLIAKTDESTGIHTRIIWCCAWSHDGDYFATGSRDGKVVVWGTETEGPPALGGYGASSEFLDLPNESITSVAYGPVHMLMDEYLLYLMAIGSEAGDIRLYGWENSGYTLTWTFLFHLSGNSAHHLTVKRLAFRPVVGETSKSEQAQSETYGRSKVSTVQLASCGLDHMLKIHNFPVNIVNS